MFDAQGRSPLHVAAEHGQLRMVQKMCEYCEHAVQAERHDLDHTDNRGRTPLHLCAGRGFKECAEYLLSVGADATILDMNRCNAHSFAWFIGVWDASASASSSPRNAHKYLRVRFQLLTVYRLRCPS